MLKTLDVSIKALVFNSLNFASIAGWVAELNAALCLWYNDIRDRKLIYILSNLFSQVGNELTTCHIYWGTRVSLIGSKNNIFYYYI